MARPTVLNDSPAPTAEELDRAEVSNVESELEYIGYVRAASGSEVESVFMFRTFKLTSKLGVEIAVFPEFKSEELVKFYKAIPYTKVSAS